MELIKAIDINPGESLAFIGAGGKTTTMFSLAKTYGSPIVLTTSTHIGAWQALSADQHCILDPGATISELNFEKGHLLLITGQPDEEDRLVGLDMDTLAVLSRWCKSHEIPLLIEADGARQSCLKAPADHEPNLPAWIERVVVVSGMNALGKPLTSKYVHRPERFSELTGLKLGDIIRIKDYVSLLKSTQGGLKGIPPRAQRVLFLNQAEEPILQASAGRIARSLTSFYDRILIGSLHASQPEDAIACVCSKTAGVVLAAGGSRRLGRPKQLLRWQGETYIRCVVKNALAAGLEPLVVITGSDHDEIVASIRDLPVMLTHNSDWPSGMASSMKAGLCKLPDDCESVMFLLADQPHISTFMIRQLLERFAQHRAPITAPRVNDRRANPVLFSEETFDALMTVRGDQGGRAVFHQFDVDWLPWMDERVLLDVDEPEDEQTLLDAYFLGKQSE